MHDVVTEYPVCLWKILIEQVHCKKIRVRQEFKYCEDFNHPINHLCSKSFWNLMVFQWSWGITHFLFGEALQQVIFSLQRHVFACGLFNSILNRSRSFDLELWSWTFSWLVTWASDRAFSFLGVNLRRLWLVSFWGLAHWGFLGKKGVLLRDLNVFLLWSTDFR